MFCKYRFNYCINRNILQYLYIGPNVEPNISRSEGQPAQNVVRPCLFNVGDKVQVAVEVAILKTMQQGHGGWNPRMAKYIGKIGTVHRVTDRGDIRVQYDGKLLVFSITKSFLRLDWF